MKKVLGVLVALLVATPAMADVNVTVTDAGEGWAEISYAAPGEPNLPRAFALKIEVDSSAKIDKVQFSKGTGDEECATCEPFDIYPGNIIIDTGGNVTGWGSPVAPPGAPDAPPPLNDPDGYIIVEMGSLYEKGSADPVPAASGLLIRAHVTADSNMCVTEEALVRGGVVLEDPAIDPTVNGDCTFIDFCTIDAVMLKADLCGSGYGPPDGLVEFWDYQMLNYYSGQTVGAGKKCSELPGGTTHPNKDACDLCDICSVGYGPPDDIVEFWDYQYLNYCAGQYGGKVCHE